MNDDNFKHALIPEHECCEINKKIDSEIGIMLSVIALVISFVALALALIK